MTPQAVTVDLERAKLLYAAPMPMREVARILDVNESTLLWKLKRTGWKPRGRARRGQTLSLEQKDEIERSTYRGESLSSVARRTGHTLRTVKRYAWRSRL